MKKIPPYQNLNQRLANFPTEKLPIGSNVDIRWNDYQVPYIIADNDADAAFALGMVHAHLRLAQMEISKYIVNGRLSEIFSFFTIRIDSLLRTLDIGRMAKQTYQNLSDNYRCWLDHYVAGINCYRESLDSKELPAEFNILSLKDEPWTAIDSLAIGRLSGIDVNWSSWFELLSLKDKRSMQNIWQFFQRIGQTSTSFTEHEGYKDRKKTSRFSSLLRRAFGFRGRGSGSNSVVVGAGRSSSGSAMIASDPHLDILLPNLWLMVGLRCPSYKIVGMMIPGLPLFGFGRTPDIAWGGTNMHAMSSEVVDVSSLDKSQFTTRYTTIKVRYWFNKKIRLRETPYGPLITDAKMVPKKQGRCLALRWLGHQPSCELSSLLNAAKAKDWQQFQQAFSDFSVPAENFLYADKAGNIGHILAAKLPKRTTKFRKTLIVSPQECDDNWQTLLNSLELPSIYNPKKNYLASANNQPIETDYPIGCHFSPPERFYRLQQLLEANDTVSVDDLKKLQHDFYSLMSLELIRTLSQRMQAIPKLMNNANCLQIHDLFIRWDGEYGQESKMALVFESFISVFAKHAYQQLRQQTVFQFLKNTPHFRYRLLRDIEKLDDSQLSYCVHKAVKQALPQYHSVNVWGDVHRISLQHFLGYIPWFGRKYRIKNIPASGSNETVLKRAHPLTVKRHNTYYGSQARHISDMVDLDANYFLLFGGQDGWINSQNFADQVELWRQSQYIQIPLSEMAIEEQFPLLTRLQPKV